MTTKYYVYLTKENRQELETLIHSGESSARTQTRARILLLTDEGQKKKKGTKEIASALLCSMPTIKAIRKKFSEGGVQVGVPLVQSSPRCVGRCLHTTKSYQVTTRHLSRG